MNSTDEHTDLVAVPTDQAMEVFTADHGLDPYLKQIRQEIDGFVPDLTTAKGRSEIASMAHKIARSKTALDGVGKQLVADLKDVPRKIDAERKRMRDLLDEWKAEVRQPLTEFEEAEKARIAEHESELANIEALAYIDDDSRLTSEDIQGRIDAAESVSLGDEWEEFEARAARTKEAVINSLKVRLSETVAAEERAAKEEADRKAKEEAERKEREERIAKEAAEAERKAAEKRAEEERERIEAERKAEREESERKAREESERIERERQAERDEAARKERERLEAVERERREAAEAEAERLRKIQAEKDEADRRAKNIEHRRKINAAAKDALVSAGLPAKQAETAVRAIAAGDVPAVTITY